MKVILMRANIKLFALLACFHYILDPPRMQVAVLQDVRLPWLVQTHVFFVALYVLFSFVCFILSFNVNS